MLLRVFQVVCLLTISNVFMTLAWYGHLYFKKWGLLTRASIFGLILVSWGLAFFEYVFQVPANRLGHREHGGPLSLFQLKTLQEAVSLIVFTLITIYGFRTERLAWNHVVAFGLLVAAVFLVFRKW